MTTTNDSLKLAELLKTPICKMDGEELAFLITSITSNQQAQMLLTQPKYHSGRPKDCSQC